MISWQPSGSNHSRLRQTVSRCPRFSVPGTTSTTQHWLAARLIADAWVSRTTLLRGGVKGRSDLEGNLGDSFMVFIEGHFGKSRWYDRFISGERATIRSDTLDRLCKTLGLELRTK